MAGKFQMITDLYQQAVKEVTKSPDNWVSFLESASRNYRLPFDEQILVHVQRPDATAVLQIEHWNRRFGRWVRKGSKGIAVLDKSAGEMALKYYFDISDTQESRNQSLVRPVPLWEVREEYREEVQETLANAFSADDRENLESTILQASKNIAEENMRDYLEDMLAERENSTLEELDEMNVRLKVRTILENSVAWMLLSRCGCDVQAYLTGEDFADIVDFDTPELINILGTAASDLGELPLREIADTISKQLRYEKKRYRTFAFGSGGGYSVAIGGRKEENEDGSNRIQKPRGLSSSQSDRAGGTESRWEVRITPQEVSERKPLWEISESADAGETEPAPDTDSERRYREDGNAHPADETGTERDGAAQGGESDGVGRTDEQHPAGGRGNRAGGTDLQLKDSEPPSEEDSREEKTDTAQMAKLAGGSVREDKTAENLPTVGEQMELIGEAEDKKSSAFSSFGGIPQGVTQEDIDSVLVGGNGVADRKYRIYHQFGKQKEKKSNVEFLKREYGTGGTSHTYQDGTDGYVWYSAKGIAIVKKGSYSDPDLLLSWSKVEKRLCELMRDNSYLNPYEKDHYADFLESISAPQYEIDTERKLARQRFILEKAELPPEEKRDTLALRLADFIRDLDGYEKSLLENAGHSDLADVTASQMEQHLSDPATAQNLLDFLALVQGKTTDTYIRSNAWRFSQELRELYPAHIENKKTGDRTQPGETNVIGEQLNIQEKIEKSDREILPDFSISMVEDVLCFDEYMDHKRFDIQLFFQGHEEEQERIRYLKESYGGEYRHFDIDGKRVGYKAEENHLLVWEGNYLTRTAESRFSWREVQGQIAGMMERGMYYNRNPFGELPSEDEQLSLFDFGFDLQTVSTGQGVPALQPEKPQRFALPQQIIDEMLCLGGNEPGSVGRICANYMHSRTPEENIAFLKQEYGEDGTGFVSSRGKVSVWYQDDGIHLAKGDTARQTRNSMVVSWEQADRRILELLQQGRYAPQEVLDGALPNERQELANELCYLRRDVSEGIVLLDEYFRGGFPTKTKRIAEALQDSQQREHIIEKLEKFALAYEEDSSLMRFHSRKPGVLLERLKILRQEPVAFLAQGEFSEPELFISQDEIDALLINRGSGFQYGKYRIYSYFLHDHSEAECISFLKKEYGTGGMGKRWYHEDHGAKGIILSRGDLMKPYDKVSLSWKQVTSRIKRLIREERYLSEKETAYIPEYEKGVLAAEIYHFYSNQPEEIVRPYPQGAYYDDAVEAIVPQLEQTGRVDEILDSMAQVFVDRYSDSMKKAYRDLQEFREGKYTLFPNLPEKAARILAKTKLDSVPEQPESLVEDEQRDTKGDAEFKQRADRRESQGQKEEPLPVWERDEIEVLGDILSAIKIEDIFLDYEDGVLTARDEDNEWKGEEFYHFLLDEAIVLEEDGTSTFLTGEQLEDLYTLAGRYGILTAMPGLPAEEEKKAGMPAEKEDAQEQPAGDGDMEVSQAGGRQSPSALERGEDEENHADLMPAWERKLPKAGLLELHPEIPPAERNQYRITDDTLGHGTPKEKFRANIAAIQLLKKCEAENRLATPDEQEILAKYVGWGGLSDAFDETKASWGTEYLELKTVLTPEEYAAARESTLTAFYTPPVVIRAVYQALENMGLKSGNILEPSCGVGNFIGMKPESLSDCKVYGVEIDPISAGIAGQLYQKSSIAGRGYEDVAMPDSFFDAAVGNVPFGQFKVPDKRYDKHNFLIHDYFFAKTLDKVRPGGIIAFITSSGTMDKKNGAARKYIAERAELLGAVRLPNDTFQKNAGTRVTVDILFLQKKEYVMAQEPDWIFLDRDENGTPMNRYFVRHPEMILGEMVMESSRFGMDSTCKPREGISLDSQLKKAIQNIQAEISDYEVEELVEEDDQSIPANPEVANFSYSVVDGKIYYRENSRMKPVELSITGQNRVRGMIAIRDSVRRLIEYQTEDYPESDIKKEQENLNRLYDVFQNKYGPLNSRGNSMVFSEDNSYPLLCSLEVMDEDGTLKRKADMFHKRTIKPKEVVRKADTAGEALAISLAECAKVDMELMERLCGKSREEIEQELGGVIFRLPDAGENPVFVTADEYLSGNVREKLNTAKLAYQGSEVYRTNVEALEKVQPEDLSAMEIKVRLGTTWIPAEAFQNFMYDLLQTSEFDKRFIKVHYSDITSQWSVEGKSRDRGNVKAGSTYGTSRANAYRIIEDSLNLRDTRVYDYIEDEEGRKKAVLNKEETAVAQGKQEIIRQAFEEWVWKDPERRERLVRQYNDTFNAIRPREYDGSHLTFPGMNPEICLRTHQVNAIARIIYGGNTLLAHVVGAGKTYTMVAAAMKMKQMGLCHKSMVVVPNHIIEQFAAEWLQLYPSANILVATKKSFEKKNRKKFCARIATGDYDAVIIGHSQFERIPISIERQRMVLEQQMREVLSGIDEVKQMAGERFTVKQLEITRKSLESKLEKLNNNDRKDDVIYFEQLGIDRLFVDEADNYKNLFLYTKMRNVGGIAQTDAQKSSDMFMKCRYMDELTGGKGIIFATGTPVSNSMVELYTMQRYLQYGLLEKYRLIHFDSWASMFGETVTAMELAPEGTGYRLKTRFARFHNIPEMMKMFKEVADIQTEDMLNLPVPKANYRVVAVKPSGLQKDMVSQLADRAERVRNGMVDPKQDNMLKITNDGRKLALDQRLTNELLPDEPESKVNACVKEIVSFWKQGKDKKLTQLVFSDLSTPKNDGSFNVYDDLREKLTKAGIPEQEIVFIHEADTDAKKKELFAKVRNGSVRVLIGSTFKMGAGTNVQNLIIASHDLDCPWRPRDLEQRRGRCIRQGNKNKEVDVIRYVTEGTFDAYMYQMIENKQKFISQVMTSKSPARSIEDVDTTALSYAEIKALASGNPAIKEKMNLDVEVSKLKVLKQSFLSQKYELENKILHSFPQEIKEMEWRILCYEKDIALEKENTPTLCDSFPAMQIWGNIYTEKKEAGKALVEACQTMTSPDEIQIGSYRGFTLGLYFNSFSKDYVLTMKGSQCYKVTLGSDIHGNITRIDNAIAGLPDKLEQCREKLEKIKVQYVNAKKEVQKTFSKEDELREKSARLEELNAMLNMKDNPLAGAEQDEEKAERRKAASREEVR